MNSGYKGTKSKRDYQDLIHKIDNHSLLRSKKGVMLLSGMLIFVVCHLMMPCSTNIFFSATTERSTCSSVWVAIRA